MYLVPKDTLAALGGLASILTNQFAQLGPAVSVQGDGGVEESSILVDS